jgi:hypothetical protein
MPLDIFKTYKKGIEQVEVADFPRGTMESETPTFTVTLDAIIKRKSGMEQSTENSEDHESRTNFHFRPSDAEYIKVGYYIKLDGTWRSIESIDVGVNPRTGKTHFIYAEVADDILPTTDEPVWGRTLSA